MARYEIVPDQSRVWISARSSLHPINSEADGLEGWLDLDIDEGEIDLRVAPSAHLEFPVAKLRSGNPLEERELKRRIEARKFPTIDGDLASMEQTDRDGRYRVRGDVVFKGVARSHEDEVTLTVRDGRTIQLEGQSTFDVRDFGMEPPRILMLRVHPDVEVRVQIVAIAGT